MAGNRQVMLPDNEKPLPAETCAAAVVTVAQNALDADDARGLLEALGLSESAGEALARVRGAGAGDDAAQSE